MLQLIFSIVMIFGIIIFFILTGYYGYEYLAKKNNNALPYFIGFASVSTFIMLGITISLTTSFNSEFWYRK